MTRGDVFIQILSELHSEPKKFIAEMLSVMKATIPTEEHRFDEEISDTEAGLLCDELMQEKEAILNWFLEGYRRFLWRTRMPQGDA
ncbi:MAG: hypothetical protein NT022_11085 [Deltaproteobacteria bacterium]|jgi:hypothetical protein|nr:hypothetical protein [Deltaproteobacteria bacterium]